MQRSIYLARLIAPVLLVVGVSVLLNTDSFRVVAQEALHQVVLIFLSGVLTLTAGVAILVAHNVWTGGWPVIITVLGWLFVVSGVIRTAAPQLAQRIGEGLFGNTSFLMIVGCIVILVAIVLGYFGYFAEAPRPAKPSRPSRRRRTK